MATKMQRYRSSVAARAKKAVADRRTGMVLGGGGGWAAAGATGSWTKNREAEGARTTFELMGRTIPIAEAAGGVIALGSALLLKKPSQAMLQTAGFGVGISVASAAHGIRKYKAA